MGKQLINLQPIKDIIKEKLIEKYDSTLYMNTNRIDIQLDIKDILEAYIAEKQLIEPKIYITTEAYCKMRKLVDDTRTEIGWYGTVTKVPGLNSTYVIEDILVYPQKVTGATCEQDEDRMFEFEMSLTTEQVNTKRFHGHSHVNMGVTPSGVDESFYQDILTQVDDYFIICITNKSNAYTVRFYDVQNNILYTDLKIDILNDEGTSLDHWYEETKKCLKEPVAHVSANIERVSSPTIDRLFNDTIDDDDDDGYYNPYWESYYRGDKGGSKYGYYRSSKNKNSKSRKNR